MSQRLSKSDFKLGVSCAKKLIYKKLKYPTSLATNEYMQMLAEGGYLIGKYATLHYPNGVELVDDLALSEKQTIEFLSNYENITLFEASISCNQKLARVDILEKVGNVINLIEVKSKSFDSLNGDIIKNLSEEILDVTYQKLVFEEAYPHFKVYCFLLVPDKSKTLLIDDLISWFKVSEPNSAQIQSFRKPKVDFVFELNSKEHQTLIENSLLTLVNVNEEVESLLPKVRLQSKDLIKILNEGISTDDYELNTKCFSCEFNTINETKNGFKECWGKMADVKPSISSLYHLGTLGGSKNPIANQLINEGNVSFYDLKPQYFYKANTKELGSRGIRQLIQYENTINNTEWFAGDMKAKVKQWQYPLHFIDFETYTGAMPHHKGMRPYETVAFQWSCHTVTSPGATPVHSEWINTERSFPNFRFAESLMQQIGTTGTLLMWATHENTVLGSILKQMEDFDCQNKALKIWLLGITTDKDYGRVGRLVDMNAFTLKNYFHPQMEGKTSIKKVLPAIWNNNSYLHNIDWLKEYVGFDLGGLIKSPYDQLSGLMADLEELEEVKDGTGAMKVYHDMQFGSASTDATKKEALKRLLLQYCRLDTMAMVIIWKYWIDKLK